MTNLCCTEIEKDGDWKISYIIEWGNEIMKKSEECVWVIEETIFYNRMANMDDDI